MVLKLIKKDKEQTLISRANVHQTSKKIPSEGQVKFFIVCVDHQLGSLGKENEIILYPQRCSQKNKRIDVNLPDRKIRLPYRAHNDYSRLHKVHPDRKKWDLQ